MPNCSTLCHPDEPRCAVSEHGRCAAAGLGQWNAYVEAGLTPEERKRRLAQVPAHYREQVAGHVRLVWRLRRLPTP